MPAGGGPLSVVADCDPALFCDMPTWGPYDGPLHPVGAAAGAELDARAAAAPRRAGRRAARRLRRAVRAELRAARR